MILLEWALFVLVVSVFVSQVGYPWTAGRPLWPSLRRRRKAIEAELKDVEQEAVDEALEHRLRTYREGLAQYRREREAEAVNSEKAGDTHGDDIRSGRYQGGAGGADGGAGAAGDGGAGGAVVGGVQHDRAGGRE